MKTNLKFVIASICISLLFVSCKDEHSIQTYFVDHQELPEFMSLDVATSLLDMSNADLNEEELAAYNSVRKLDILAYQIADNNLESYTKELEKAKTVFKNEKYEELMVFKDNGVNFKISTIGDENSVDEFLVLANSKDTGFGVVRVIGDDMKPEELIKLVNKMQDADIDQGQLNDIMGFFNK